MDLDRARVAQPQNGEIGVGEHLTDQAPPLFREAVGQIGLPDSRMHDLVGLVISDPVEQDRICGPVE